MVERMPVGGVQHRGGSGRGKAVEHDRHAAEPRRDHRSGDCGELEPAEAPQHVERVARRLTMECHRLGDGAPLGLQRGSGDPGAGSGPQLRRAAEEPGAQSSRGGGIADAHLAQRQRVYPRLDRHHSVGHRAWRIPSRSSPARRRCRRSVCRGSSRRP